MEVGSWFNSYFNFVHRFLCDYIQATGCEKIGLNVQVTALMNMKSFTVETNFVTFEKDVEVTVTYFESIRSCS